jgi:transposase InsO family protein
MARRAGWQVNNKRIRRLWRDEGLRVPQRRRKKRLTGIGVAVGAMSPIRPNVIWAMDFQFDTTADGRTLKMLNVIDEYTREALARLIAASTPTASSTSWIACPSCTGRRTTCASTTGPSSWRTP